MTKSVSEEVERQTRLGLDTKPKQSVLERLYAVQHPAEVQATVLETHADVQIHHPA